MRENETNFVPIDDIKLQGEVLNKRKRKLFISALVIDPVELFFIHHEHLFYTFYGITFIYGWRGVYTYTTHLNFNFSLTSHRDAQMVNHLI